MEQTRCEENESKQQSRLSKLCAPCFGFVAKRSKTVKLVKFDFFLYVLFHGLLLQPVFARCDVVEMNPSRHLVMLFTVTTTTWGWRQQTQLKMKTTPRRWQRTVAPPVRPVGWLSREDKDTPSSWKRGVFFLWCVVGRHLTGLRSNSPLSPVW